MERKRLGIIVMLFILCFSAIAGSFYEAGTIKERARVLEEWSHDYESDRITKTDPALTVDEIFHAKPRNSQSTWSVILRLTTVNSKILILFAVLFALTPLRYMILRRERERFLCRFQAYIHNMLEILYSIDGKRRNLFCMAE